MSLSHSVRIANKQNDSIDPILQFLDNITNVQQAYGSFEKAEKAIKELVVELEKSMVQETLSQYDINTAIVVRDGKVYHQVLRGDKTYMSTAGLVTVERSLYRAEGQCICPLELQSGIMEGYWTPGAARIGCYVTAQLSPYQGEKLFKEFGGLHPSKSALGRLSTQLGENWESEQAQLEQLFCTNICIPENAVTVSAFLDGIMIPLNKAVENGYQAPVLAENPTKEDKQEYQEKKEKPFTEKPAVPLSIFMTKRESDSKQSALGACQKRVKRYSKTRFSKVSIQFYLSSLASIWLKS